MSATQLTTTTGEALASHDFGVVLREGYQFERQAKTNWCWAAISSFVSAVWCPHHMTQHQIATALGQQDLNNPVRLTSALEVVLSETDIQRLGFVRIGQIGEQENFVKTMLSRDRCPIPVAVDWNTNDPSDAVHFICIFSVDEDFGIYEIYDPWQTRPEQDLTIARPLEYLNSYAEDGGVGKATHIYKWRNG